MEPKQKTAPEGLPGELPKAALRKPEPEALQGRKHARILLVDDDPMVAKALTRGLGRCGYECATSVNPIEALALYKQGGFDLVISERQMPEMGGLELLQEIRKHDPAARVIILSGGMSVADEDRFHASGAAAVMGKPFDADLMKIMAGLVLESSGKVPASPEKREAGKALSVLVVDDDMDNLGAMRDVLEALGYEPVAFSRGIEAVARYMQGGIDVVITDFHMPEMDGLQVVTAIKALDHRAAIVVASAEADSDERQALKCAGAMKVLRKPIDMAELEQAIEAAGNIKTA
ncbi:MAG: response regulator [Candidatus Micrarchaeota archaeon]